MNGYLITMFVFHAIAVPIIAYRIIKGNHTRTVFEDTTVNLITLGIIIGMAIWNINILIG